MSQERRPKGLRETLAATGVVLSLIFVGYELRQNTQVARAAAVQAISDQSVQVILAWTSDTQSLQLLRQVLGGATPDAFTDDENIKLRLMFLALLRLAESRHRQAALGVVEDPTIFGGSASALRSPYLKALWDDLRPSVAPDFAELFEQEYELR